MAANGWPEAESNWTREAGTAGDSQIGAGRGVAVGRTGAGVAGTGRKTGVNAGPAWQAARSRLPTIMKKPTRRLFPNRPPYIPMRIIVIPPD